MPTWIATSGALRLQPRGLIDEVQADLGDVHEQIRVTWFNVDQSAGLQAQSA